MMRQLRYESVRRQMAPGDVILFGGRGMLSWAIKRLTHSPVSHAGMVTFCASEDDAKDYRVRVTDSTSLDGRRGVFTRYLSDVLALYDGDVWWLALRPDVRVAMNERAMRDFLLCQEGARYDIWQCLRAGWNAFFGWNLTPVQEDAKRVFCSEYVALALKAAGLHYWRNCSTVTPSQLAAAPIYTRTYAQLKGAKQTIQEFNGARTL